MPSTATITAYYSFSANTKARATQVNNNFDVYRGHIIPVEVLTATSANNTYDLGSTEYSWRYVYAQTLRRAAVSSGTLTAAESGFAVSNTISSGFVTTAAMHIVNSTATVTTYGRPVRVQLVPSGPANQGGMVFLSLVQATASTGEINLHLLRDGVTISTQRFIFEAPGNIGAANHSWPASSVSFIDFATAGAHSYSLSGKVGLTTFITQASISDAKLIAYEV